MQAQRVAVVGGGIAGLGAAWRLARRGYAVAVLERERELGGRAASERVESLWLDRGGRRVSTADRTLLAWIRELGLGRSLLPLRPLDVYQVCRDRAARIDTRGPLGVARIPGVRLHEALRLVRLPRLLRRYGARLDPRHPERAADLDDRSLADFARLYFGRSVLERWLEPLVASRASTTAHDTSRVLFLLGQSAEGDALVGTLRAPLEALWATLRAALDVHCESEVGTLLPRPSGAIGVPFRAGHSERVLEADAVVVATPPAEASAIAAPLLAGAEREVLAACSGLPAISLVVGLARAVAPRPQEIRVPRCEGLPIDGLWLEPEATGGGVAGDRWLARLRATDAWSRTHVRAPDETVSKDLGEVLERVVPAARGGVTFTRVQRWEYGLPAFPVDHYRQLERFWRLQVDRRREGRRLYFAGDHLIAPTLEGALVAGQRAADALHRDLEHPS